MLCLALLWADAGWEMDIAENATRAKSRLGSLRYDVVDR
jgi:hypothetical protein